MPRCPNGTRRNKNTKNCETKTSRKIRCPNKTRKHKITGKCENKITSKLKKLELKLNILKMRQNKKNILN